MASTWPRSVLVALAVPNLVTGGWAVAAPQHWYDNFPGWAPRLVSAIPPYNEHLASDAGAGLLATGVLAALAAIWYERTIVLTAMAGFLAFALPHALFHLTHPADALSTAEDAVNTGSLLVAAAAAGAVAFAAAQSVRPTVAR